MNIRLVGGRSSEMYSRLNNMSTMTYLSFLIYNFKPMQTLKNFAHLMETKTKQVHATLNLHSTEWLPGIYVYPVYAYATLSAHLTSI
jgi:hypothetical protein